MGQISFKHKSKAIMRVEDAPTFELIVEKGPNWRSKVPIAIAAPRVSCSKPAHALSSLKRMLQRKKKCQTHIDKTADYTMIEFLSRVLRKADMLSVF